MAIGDVVELVNLTKFPTGWEHEMCKVLTVSKTRVKVEKLNGIPAKVDKTGTMSVTRTCGPTLMRKIPSAPAAATVEGGSSASTAGGDQMGPPSGPSVPEISPEEEEARGKARAAAAFGLGDEDDAYA